jgi:hypothetical protein
MNPEHTRHEQLTAYATTLTERFAQGMLAELAPYRNFVVWRYRLIDGQEKKPPFNPNTHQPASPTDSKTWGTLASALSAVATGGFQGIGFMLSHSPFSGLDLDHCLQDGTVEPWAKEIIETLNTYTEYSPSWNRKTGTGGVHLLLAGKPPSSKKVGTIEIYGQKRYLTLTTNHLQGTPTTINSRQEALDALYRRFAPPVVHGDYQNTRGGEGAQHHSPNSRRKQSMIAYCKNSCEAIPPALPRPPTLILCWFSNSCTGQETMWHSPASCFVSQAYTGRTRPIGKPERQPILI